MPLDDRDGDLRAGEGRRGRALDQHVDEVTRCGGPGEVDRRVSARTSAGESRVGAARALYEDLLDAPDPLLVTRGGVLWHELAEPLDTVTRHLVGSLFRHV